MKKENGVGLLGWLGGAEAEVGRPVHRAALENLRKSCGEGSCGFPFPKLR